MSDLYTDRIEDIDHAISAVIAKHTSGIRKKSKCKKLAVWEMMKNKKCWTKAHGPVQVSAFKQVSFVLKFCFVGEHTMLHKEDREKAVLRSEMAK